MPWPSLKLCALILSLSAAVTAQQAAAKAVPTGYRIEEGNWGGGSYNEESGAFAFCFIGTKTGDGNRIGVFLLADASLWLTVMNDRWTLSRDQRYPASLEADGTHRQVSGEFKVGSIVFDLHQDPVFFNAMRNGRELRFVGASSTVAIDLRPDTLPALTALERCLAKHAGLDLQGASLSGGGSSPSTGEPSASQNPFAPSAPATTPAQPPAAAAADYPYEQLARSLLVRSGYPEPVIMDLRDQPRDYTDFVLGWLGNDGPVGFLGALPAPGGGDFTDEFVSVLARAAVICGAVGDPAYDPLVTSASGADIYSGSLRCSKDGAVAVYFVSSVVDGEVLVFMHFARQSDLAQVKRISANLRQALRSM